MTSLTYRTQFLISQALMIAIKHLKALEERDEKYPVDGEHAQPSDREDMERLFENTFSMYKAVEEANESYKQKVTYISDKKPTMDELKDMVGGHVEMKTFDGGEKQMIMDEEGKLKNKPVNISATEMLREDGQKHTVVGDVVILVEGARLS